VQQKAFKFTVSGSIKMQVAGSNKLPEGMLPYTAQLDKPAAAISAKDMRSSSSKSQMELSGPLLSPEERLWLGTASDFVTPQLIVSAPQVIGMYHNNRHKRRLIYTLTTPI
jgi:hypothetical protein